MEVGEINTNCGIYKITSPSGRIYIGESKELKRRIAKYKKMYKSDSRQHKLYNSLKKYGWEAHVIEVIEECEIDELLCRERFWQDFYDVLGQKGLNCKLTECGDKKQVHSEETIEKMRAFHTGKEVSMETRERMRVAQSGENSAWYGKRHSEETKQLIRISKIGGKNPSARLVLHLETGIFYDTAKEASEACGMNKITFHSYLSGRVKSKSISYIYV